MSMNKKRCDWVTSDPLYIDYHDKEWGRPAFDDKTLFEYLNLEGAQAGLSWLTVLKKRAHYRKVFYDFDPHKIVKIGAKEQAQLLTDPGIIRNRLKVAAFIENAKTYLTVCEQHGSFSDFIWQFVDGQPVVNHWQSHQQVPVTTTISDKMSKELKRLGFKFVGSTICYAYMQAVGMVDDHLTTCFLRTDC